MIDQIKNLEFQFDDFTQKVGEVKGEYKILLNQQNKCEKSIVKYKEDEITYSQAVELLSLVQKVTTDRIKDAFENIVTHALNYIYESDEYSFHLVFSRRGNLHELSFAVQTPTKPEPLDPMVTDAGGTLNIISFVLRVVLMEVSNPKIKGFIINDETFANLDPEYQIRASEFLNEINTKFKKQILMITHSNEFIDNSNYNKIEIK